MSSIVIRTLKGFVALLTPISRVRIFPSLYAFRIGRRVPRVSIRRSHGEVGRNVEGGSQARMRSPRSQVEGMFSKYTGGLLEKIYGLPQKPGPSLAPSPTSSGEVFESRQSSITTHSIIHLKNSTAMENGLAPVHFFSHGSTAMLGEQSDSADYWKECGDAARRNGIEHVVIMVREYGSTIS